MISMIINFTPIFLLQENRRLSKSPTEEVAKLQEDLVAIKLREAETSLSLKESQKRLTELNKMWMVYLACWRYPDNTIVRFTLSTVTRKDPSYIIKETWRRTEIHYMMAKTRPIRIQVFCNFPGNSSKQNTLLILVQRDRRLDLDFSPLRGLIWWQ